MSNAAAKSSLPLSGYPPRMRVNRVATCLNCSEALVVSLIRSGKLAAVDTCRSGAKRSYYLVDRAEVAAFEARSKAT
ncbi:MAG TPA: hypothetical protein VHZ30_03120 [Verrucomicrobiae bacterium]|nr:hypothetical protein [Verrucomicrobiae bacterium]